MISLIDPKTGIDGVLQGTPWVLLVCSICIGVTYVVMRATVVNSICWMR